MLMIFQRMNESTYLDDLKYEEKILKGRTPPDTLEVDVYPDIT